MSNTRYDLTQAKSRKDGKIYWHKIGTMFSNDKGGFDITFDSLPVSDYHPDYGNQVRVKAFEAKTYEGKENNASSVKPKSKANEFDDDIPF